MQTQLRATRETISMKYPYDRLRDEICTGLASAINLHYGIDIDVRLEMPSEHADAAFPCFSLAKITGVEPSVIAQTLAAVIDSDWAVNTEAVGGYVNFFIDIDRLAQHVLALIDDMKDQFGMHESRGVSVIVEHTSANPNGPLHVGRARNPIIGDTLARLFRWDGYDVDAQFYVDDMGKQVATLLWGLQHLDIEPEGKKLDHRMVAYYQKANAQAAENDDVKREITEIIQRCEGGNKKVLHDMKKAYQGVLDGIMESLQRINITINSFVEESRFVLDGSVQQIVEALKESNHTGYEDGALYLDLDAFGVHGRTTKFFLTRNDGTTLYATRDIAYHRWKARQADQLLNILGEDHKLEAKLVEVALTILGVQPPKSVFYSFVSLPDGKMSTRQGRVVYLDDLVEEAVERAYMEVMKRREVTNDVARIIAEHVGTGAVRYNIIKVRPEKAITFCWEEALNFEGRSAPFIQYAHARCCAILRKVSISSFSQREKWPFTHQQEQALIKQLAAFPDIITASRIESNPAAMAEYAHSLASTFNAFYRDCRVIGSKKESGRLALVKATQVTLHNALHLLGITALEEM